MGGQDRHIALLVPILEIDGAQRRLVPPLITAYEHEVWVGFLAGEPLGPTDEAQLVCLADFCAHVCRLDATRAELSETAFP